MACLALAGVMVGPVQPAHASHPFVPGEATAIAETVQLAPSTGGLSASVTVGTTIAQYRSTLAQASSQTLNLGVIGSTLTVQCDSSPPALKPDQLPQPLLAESDRGNSHASKQTAGSGNSGMSAVAGREVVHAWTQPKAQASFDGGTIAVPGSALEISGLHAESHSVLVKNTSRTATASARIGSIKLLKGAIALEGLKWTALQRTGKGAHKSGHFSIQGIKLAGKSLPVSPPKLDASISTINKALTATGLHINLPAKTVSHGRVTVTPLEIGIDKSQVGNSTLNPILTALTPVTNAVMTALVGVSCKIGAVLGAVDLIQSGFDGTGGLDLNLGGVSATSDGKDYGNAFGNPPPLGGHHHQQSSTSHNTGPGGPSSSSSQTNNTSSTTNPQNGTTDTSTGRTGSSQSTSLSSSCSTTSPADRPSCSRGSGLKVGLIALGLLLAFVITDAAVLRLRRRGAEQTS